MVYNLHVRSQKGHLISQQTPYLYTQLAQMEACDIGEAKVKLQYQAGKACKVCFRGCIILRI